MKKVIKLSENDLRRIVLRVIREQEEIDMSQEMDENIFGDIGRGIRRFAKGHGSEDEKEMDKERFYEMLDAFENELENMDWENKYYPDEETWEDAKEELIDKAEDNDYIGELAIVDASGFDVDEIDSRTRLIYRKGKTGFQHMIGGATDALSGGHTFGGGRKGTHTLGESKRNRRNYRRY